MHLCIAKAGNRFPVSSSKKYTMLMHLRFISISEAAAVEPSLSAYGGKWESSLFVWFGGMCFRAALL